MVAPFLQGARESGGVMRYNKLSGRGYDNPLGKLEHHGYFLLEHG